LQSRAETPRGGRKTFGFGAPRGIFVAMLEVEDLVKSYPGPDGARADVLRIAGLGPGFLDPVILRNGGEDEDVLAAIEREGDDIQIVATAKFWLTPQDIENSEFLGSDETTGEVVLELPNDWLGDEIPIVRVDSIDVEFIEEN
jgi:hypothetical protein